MASRHDASGQPGRSSGRNPIAASAARRLTGTGRVHLCSGASHRRVGRGTAWESRMPTLQLSLACVPNYDRTGPLLDGRVQPEGVEFGPRAGVSRPSELFRRIAQDAEFDVSEMSVSTFLVMLTRGDDRYVGLPIFPSRSFRHGFIFVNSRSGIREPKELFHARVGVTEYQQTAAVWIRGFLQDDYDLHPEDLEWVEGGLEGYRPERLAVELPKHVRIRRIAPGENLDAMLQAGELDALLGASVPPSFRQGVPHVQRLFPDY